MRHRGHAATIGLLAVLLGASPALADAIDGHWCGPNGRRLNIDGPAIVTPGGRHLRGTYDRHHFSYVVPIPEAEAGQTVAMVLMGETAVRVQLGESAPQIWNRCPAPLSLRLGPSQESRTGNG
jgi:hypothetical protein